MPMAKFVEDIAELRISDADEAGGKGANMGEMVAADLPVPPGFVLLRDCYLASMSAGGVADSLNALHRSAMAADPAQLTGMCERMQELVAKAGMAGDVRERVLEAYRRLGECDCRGARSSATGEDGTNASFAGMNATFTNVCGEQELIDAVQRCWASCSVHASSPIRRVASSRRIRRWLWWFR